MAKTGFRYIALDARGRRTAGRVESVSEAEATRELARLGLTPIQIKPAKAARSIRLRRDRVTPQDIAALTREMSVLVEAKIPIARGLRSIAEHERNSRLRDMVNDIAMMIESGDKLTVAFGKYQDVFGDVYLETIRSAEKTGTLAEVTDHLADMMERSIETRQHVKRAMTYPLIVICFVALALSVIVIFVVPRFAVIFESNNVPLPLATRLIRTIGDSVRDSWWIYLIAAFGSVYATKRIWTHPAGRLRAEALLFRLPYIGEMFSAVATARFSRVLSIGLDSGIEAIEAISIAGRSTGRPLFRQESDSICERMRSGESLEAVLQTSQRIPSFARRLLGAGKDSSELSAAGRIISRHYDRIADHLAKNINTIVEPMITIAIAGIVLIVALSVFLPMWQMVSINKS